MTKTLLLAAIGAIVLIVNPSFGCGALEPEFRYDAADMRIAIEGTWKLRVAGTPEVTLTIRQAANTEQHATRATLVGSASACGHRTFVRSAGACMDVTWMPLDVRVAGMTMKRPPEGRFYVPSTELRAGILEATLDDLRVHAEITPSGTVESAEIWRDTGSSPVSLVRVAATP